VHDRNRGANNRSVAGHISLLVLLVLAACRANSHDWGPLQLGARQAPPDVRAPPTEPESVRGDDTWKIDKLLDALAASDARCVHDGVRSSAAEAADWLRAKRRDAGLAVTSTRAFIENWGTRTSETSEPYLLELRDGRVVELGVWLTERLSVLERGGAAR
jgi:hypothetical protein